MEATILVPNSLAQLGPLNEFLSGFWGEHGLPEELAMDMNLALEEVFVNVVRYGYADSSRHDIRVSVSLEDDVVSVTVEDDGIAFNPLAAPPVDVHAPLEGRPIGGLGIHLIRNLMDEVKYARQNDHNHLVMRKRVPVRQRAS